MTMAFYLGLLPPKNITQITLIKIPDKSPKIVFLKTVRIIKNNESWSNCNSQEVPKETSQLNVTGYWNKKKDISKKLRQSE